MYREHCSAAYLAAGSGVYRVGALGADPGALLFLPLRHTLDNVQTAFAKQTPSTRNCISALNPTLARTFIAMDIDTIYKALASPLRRDILAWLKEPSLHFTEKYMSFSKGISAGQIHERCVVSKSTVSSHLAILHNAGLVTSFRVGQWILFKRNEDVLNAFIEVMRQSL